MPSRHFPRVTGAVALLGALLALLLLCISPCEAKEIEATSEWTLLGENDTLPAGLHVRMDLSTGQKWAKLVDNNDREDAAAAQEQKATTADVTSSAIAVSVEGQQEEAVVQEDYDYDMMHRTLSQLPPDEQERMGGLPELPASAAASGSSVVDPAQRQAFEARMKDIWTQRQLELKTAQREFLADLPQVLKNRIAQLEDYLRDPNMQDAADGSAVVAVLQDLEYHLSDVDMARDFHTLGGWPVLVSLLSDSVHEGVRNETLSEEELRAKRINEIQGHAAWAIGTAVKNTEEFFTWAVEPIDNSEGKQVTALSLLIKNFGLDDESEAWKLQKVIYALGALLRGNRLAQGCFLTINGPSVLGQTLARLGNGEVWLEPKVAKRIVALADDIVSDVLLHPGDDVRTDRSIIHAFTSKPWCEATLTLMQQKGLQETAMRTVRTIAPYCDWEWEPARQAVLKLQTAWIKDDGGMDPDHLKELLDLADTTLRAIDKA